MQWSPEQRKLTEKYRSLQEIPEGERRYKCFTCHTIVDSTPCPASPANLKVISLMAIARSFFH